MYGFDFVNEEIVQRLSSGVATMKTARMFVRRIGPIVTVNVVITNVEANEGTTGDLHTNVYLGSGQPLQSVDEIPAVAKERQVSVAKTTVEPKPAARKKAATPAKRAAAVRATKSAK